MVPPLRTVKSIFNAALEIESPEEREAYLAQIGAEDGNLRQQVEALLAAYLEAASFLEGSPASSSEQVVSPLPDAVGTTIGPYKLREVLGEGGMGIVYVAEQEKPIRRKVALKVIKPGMDTREVIGRFEVERQALALMDHPNIAKVLDAGTTAGTGRKEDRGSKIDADGTRSSIFDSLSAYSSPRPYFVMELVRGMPITDYCDRRKLPPRERLKLFITVCQAIQHAHKRGIIHRDLKPSNVMITLHDGKPVPKVIDFGVAKAINQKLTEYTLYTRHAQMVGTPLYMSPEQAELSGLEIDARSDVYSLGVVLYELLTGHTPVDREMISKVGYDEMRRMIREDEPPRPSQKISTLAAESRSTVSGRRSLEGRQLTRELRGELDWIVMKSLEKDRTRRYGSADALGADIQRFLDDQPVEACPPSLVYRVRKLTRRNRNALITAAILAICAPLAAFGVYTMIRGTNTVLQPPTVTLPVEETPNARAPGRELPGLVPLPAVLPEVGRWQLMTKKPRGIIRSAVWSPDWKQIALAEANHVRIYDAGALQLLHVLVAHSQPVRSVAWHPSAGRLASGAEDGTVRYWTSTGIPTHLIAGHSGPVYQVAWHPSGKQLASASADGTIRLSDENGGAIRTLEDGHRHVFGIKWSPDGKILASVGGDVRPPQREGTPKDTSVRLWDAETGRLIREFGGTEQCNSLCVDWTPDGKQLAVGYGETYRSVSAEKQMTGWQLSTGVRIWNVDGTLKAKIVSVSDSIPEIATISALAWDHQGRHLVFGGKGTQVYIRDAADGTIRTIAVDSSFDLNSLVWKGDDTHVLATSRNIVREWRADGTRSDLVAEGSPSRTFVIVRWSRDGRFISSTHTNEPPSLYWNDAGKPVESLKDSGDGSLWTERPSNTKRPDGTPGPKLEGYSDGKVKPINNWAWSKDGWLAGAKWDPDTPLSIWNADGKLVARPKGHRGGVGSVSWSPEGDWLVSGGGDSVRLWKRDGSPGPVMSGHTDEVYRAAWSPDGQWIASAGTDSTVRLWKPDGSAGPVLFGHVGEIHGIDWSPDSRRIVSGGWLDSTLRVWNVETKSTEWQVLVLTNEHSITLSASGQPIHGDRDILESDLLYLSEQRDGSIEIVPFAEFRKRHGRSFVQLFVDRCTKASGRADWDVAEVALADAQTFSRDVNDAQKQSLAAAARSLAYALSNAGENARAEPVVRLALELRQSLVAHSPEKPELEKQLAEDLNDWSNVLKENGKLAEALAAISQSVEICEKLLASQSEREPLAVSLSNALLSRAGVQTNLGEYDVALADVNRVVEINPKNAFAIDERGVINFIRGDDEKAVAAYLESIAAQSEVDNKTFLPRYHLALLQLKAGDLEGYRDNCRNLLAEFEYTNNADTAHFVGWTCSLHAGALEDYAPAIQIAERAVKLNPTNPHYVAGWGSVLFRGGRLPESVAKLTAAHERTGETRPDGKSSHAYIWYFLAMAEQALGHAAEAAEWLRKADQWTEQVLNDTNRPIPWNRRLTLNLLRVEAHQFLKQENRGKSPDSAAAELK